MVSSFLEEQGKNGGKRLTIGFFIDWLDHSYQQTIVNAMSARARGLDINLLIFDGGSINSARKYESYRNIIYDFAGKQNIDGLIILSASIGLFVDQKTIQDFCKKYLPLPVLSISYVKSIPSLCVNNSQGMSELVKHFITAHNTEKIAFIGGPLSNIDAGERLAAYVETLKTYGIKFDPSIIVHGDFSVNSGIQAIKSLIDERHASFNAVITANDDMAIGAMKALKDRGIRIPQDIFVGGFDNSELGKHSSPLLTTVDQSYLELGSRSVELLVEMINGKKIPAKTYLPTTLLVRESCGCFSQEVTSVEVVKQKDIKIYDKRDAVQYFQREDTFLENIYDYLNGKISIKNLLVIWNNMYGGEKIPENYFNIANMFLNNIRLKLYPYTSRSPELQKKAENFYHQIRIIIGERANSEERKKNQNLITEFWNMNHLNSQMIDIFEIPKMMQTLTDLLPLLDIKSCFITRFEDNRNKSRIIFSYDEGEIIPISKHSEVFSSKNLLPRGVFPSNKRYTYIIEDLWHQDHIGLALFEMGSNSGRVYGELRRVLSYRLQGAILAGQLQAQEVYLKNQSHQLEQLRRVMGGIIQTLSMTVEARDPYTAGHQRRVADLARSIATEMGLPKDMIEGIRLSSSVHDLGKIYIPSEILTKPGKLLPEEFNLIKIHPQVAYDILKTIDFPWPLAEIVYQHHERINGSGYPRGLSGDEIKLESKIIAVADVVEAMASHRPYRPAIGIEKALDEIRKNKGILYDNDVAAACLTVFEKKGYTFIY